MKKINYLFLAGLAGLASCANNEYLGEGENPENVQSNNGEILFSTRGAQVTRGGELVGATAAEKLGNKFVVAGYKGDAKSVVTGVVFNHYAVEWAANTAGTSASNTADWEYVGKAWTAWNSSHTDASGAAQTIKYWDYSKAQHDFIAFSASNASTVVTTGLEDSKLYISAVTPSTASDATNGAYKVGGSITELEKFYLADLVTVPNKDYGKEVKLTFRNLTSKVRIGIYETVPGYAVRNVQFYADGTTNPYILTAVASPTAGNDVAANTYVKDGERYYPCQTGDKYETGKDYYTIIVNSSAAAANAELYTEGVINVKGTYTVYFPTTNANVQSTNATAANYKTDLNKAHLAFTTASTGGTSTELQFNSALAYQKDLTSLTKEISGTKYLGVTSNEATYTNADKANAYMAVLPNETASSLTLRVNYTLVAEDGSGEVINVYGAKAIVPAQYCQWKSNYAYTYLFKISDNTNGGTSFVPNTPEGLFPITFDAVAMNYEDGIQETVTTVATPSITTYSPGVQPTADNEYTTGKTIYVMVNDKEHAGCVVKDLGTNGKLYAVTGTGAISEASVMDALNIRTSATGSPITGRNNVILTEATLAASLTSIEGADGNPISKVTCYGTSSAAVETAVSTNNVASFTAGASGTVYAYVYKVADGADDTFNTAVKPANGTDVSSGYYTDFACTVSASGTADGSTTYYQKITNLNDTYAVKVIRIK